MESAQSAVLALFEKQQLFPRALSQKYPYVLARIVEAWASPETIDACFEELMLADPRRKQGFPEEVMTEIFALAKLYDTLYPKPASSPFDFWRRSQMPENAEPAQVRDASREPPANTQHP